MQSSLQSTCAASAPTVVYSARPAAGLLEDPGVLALIAFAPVDPLPDDPRALGVFLEASSAPAPCEVWRVDAPVRAGRDGLLRWAEGGGWLFAAVDQPDDGQDIRACARRAYATLVSFLHERPDYHVQRLWNYLDAINSGHGDDERYRKFCAGRLEGMGEYFAEGFPAATAVGHARAAGQLQLYCLAARAPGHRIENPRQMSAWRYPREYGPVSPSFARAMRLPGDEVLAISGTAAINGHRSQHHGDLAAQLEETLTNIRSLLHAGAMTGSLGRHSPLKAYVRHRDDMPAVEAFLARHVPDAPRLLLHADICRRELLVEIDGWHCARND